MTSLRDAIVAALGVTADYEEIEVDADRVLALLAEPALRAALLAMAGGERCTWAAERGRAVFVFPVEAEQ
jgi:hypothetical protein